MITKKIIWCFISLLFLLGILYLSYTYYSLAGETVDKYNMTAHKKDTLTIIFIGDSWASYHSEYDQHLKTCLERKIKKNTKVISKGAIGAKTKHIYTIMHVKSPSGTKELIESSPDYAIVSAGINDAVAKMGIIYFCHHYKLIIKELISVGIKPIIIEMPQVDYKAVYERESYISQIRHRISSWLTDAPLWTFEEYRTALQSLIEREGLRKHLIYIPASEWNPEGYKDSRHLYLKDHVHLNEKGYFLLDSCITSKIHSDIWGIHTISNNTIHNAIP